MFDLWIFDFDILWKGRAGGEGMIEMVEDGLGLA